MPRLILILLLLASDLMAGRSFTTPSLVRRSAMSFPNVNPPDVPLKVGAVLNAFVTVRNQGSIEQEVRVILDQGTQAYTNTSLPVDICLVTGGGPGRSVTGSGYLQIGPGSPVYIDLRIAPHSIANASFLAVFSSSSLPDGKRSNLHVLFYPAITFKVTQDQGVISATVGMHTESSSATGGMGGPTCDITGSADFSAPPPLPYNNLAEPQVLVNGGKPF